jgi:hypothetical protein
MWSSVLPGRLRLTASAPLLGPQLTGLLAPFPVYAAILTVFAQRQRGPAAAGGVLRGLLLGLSAFATFFLVVATLITPLGIALTFVIAILSALLVQAASLGFMRFLPRYLVLLQTSAGYVRARGRRLREE